MMIPTMMMILMMMMTPVKMIDTSHDCDVHDDESNNDCVDDDEQDHDEDDDTSHYESDHESDDDAEGFDDIDVEQCMTLLDNLTPSEAADPVQSTLPSATCSDDTELRPWRGFKIVGDNVDKNFRRSFQRMDYQTQSFHYFHSYAVVDRVNMSHLSDIAQVGKISLVEILPMQKDLDDLNSILSVLISRYILIHVFC